MAKAISRRTTAASAWYGALGVLVVAGSALLPGCGGPASETKEPVGQTPGAAQEATPPAASADGRVVMTVDGAGFHPDRIHARVGQPITLSITRTTNETCGTEIVIPSERIRQDLPLNQTIEVTLTPDVAGEIQFACGMDMLKGTILAERSEVR